MSEKVDNVRSLSAEGLQVSDNPENAPEWMNNSMLAGIDVGARRRKSRDSFGCLSSKVEITGAEIRKDSRSSFAVYILVVHTAADKWKIRRRYTDFVYLHQQLKRIEMPEKLPSLPPKKFIGNSLDPSFLEHRRRALQAYISALITKPELWIGNELIFFLDSESKQLLFLWNVERMRRMRDMLNAMTLENTNGDKAELSSEMASAQHRVKELQNHVSQLEMFFLQHATGKASDNLSESKIRSLSGGDDPGFTTMEEESEELRRIRAGSDLQTEDNSNSDLPIEVNSAFQTAVIKRYKSWGKLSERQILEVLDLASGQSMEKQALSKDSLRRKSADEVESLALSFELRETMRLSSEILMPEDPIPDAALKDGRSTSSSIMETIESPQISEVPPLSEKIAKDIDNLILGLAPTQETLKKREDVVDFVKGVALVTHRALAYSTGTFVREVFMADGELDITLCLSRLQYVRPFVALNEALCASVKNQSHEDETDDTDGSNEGSNRFEIERVSFSTSNDIEKCRANINGVPVDISANQLRKFIESIFLEKIDEAVGGDHLFKKSLHLLTAWFYFEAPKYVNATDNVYFGESSSKISSWTLSVMLILIFNIYGTKIHHPFQALGLFLEYYDAVDFEKCAITIHGLSSCDNPTEVVTTEETSACFFHPDLLESPKNSLASLTVAAFKHLKADKKYEEKLLSGSLNLDLADQEHLEDENEVVVGEITVSMDENSDNEGNSTHPFISCFRSQTRKFKKGLINVMDPLEPTLNLTRHIDTFCLKSIKELIQGGASDYAAFIMKNKEDEKTSVTDFFQFASVFARHKQVGTASFFDSRCEEYECSLEIMQLILCSVPSVGGLARLITYILDQRGPLPVGEIGKQLLEFTCSDQLVKNIKQRYGGLKKMIELHENLFSLGIDHPFNPIVSLKDNFEPTSFPMKHVDVDNAQNSPVMSNSTKTFLPLTKTDSAHEEEKAKDPAGGDSSSLSTLSVAIPIEEGGNKSRGGLDKQRSRGNSNLSEDNTTVGSKLGGGAYSPRKARNNRKFKRNLFPAQHPNAFRGIPKGGGMTTYTEGYPPFVHMSYGAMDMQGMSGNQQYYMMPPQVPMYPIYGFTGHYNPHGPVNLEGAKFYDDPPSEGDKSSPKKDTKK